jgi:hypothetical protein
MIGDSRGGGGEREENPRASPEKGSARGQAKGPKRQIPRVEPFASLQDSSEERDKRTEGKTEAADTPTPSQTLQYRLLKPPDMWLE